MPKQNATDKKQNSRKRTSAPPARPQTRLDAQAQASNGKFLDEYAKRDMAGVVFIVAAVILMLFAIFSPDGTILGGVANYGLHHAFGVGSYILPFVLLVVGITFLFKTNNRRISLRASLGLGIIYLALLAFIALFTPIANLGVDDADLLLAESAVVSHGGYVGAGIAWVGVTLFGKIVTGVILVGIMLIGAIVIGFSISKLLDQIRKAAKIRAVTKKNADQSFAQNAEGVTGTPMRQPKIQLFKQKGLSEAVLDAQDDTSLSTQKTQTLGFAPRHRDNATTKANEEACAEVDTSAKTQLIGSSSYKPTSSDVQAGNTRTSGASAGVLTRKLGKHANTSAQAQSPAKKTRVPKKSAQAPELIEKDGFTLPPMSLLSQKTASANEKRSQLEFEETAAQLQQTLSDFGIDAKVVGWVAGPTVTLYKVDLPSGVRVNRVTSLNTDISLALATTAVRIFAPIPGTNYVGIEVPNKTRDTVVLSEVLQDAPQGPLQLAIGKDVEGNSIVCDLAKMPHLLIGGTTGSGKSVSINGMIMSILMRATPSEVRFIMVDPKRVEFTPYNGIPHLYVPVVTEPREAASALAWGVAEMERRLKVMSGVGVRNITQYNEKVLSGELSVDEDGNEIENPPEKLPYIVIIIDELADLMMSVGKEVEQSICRIAQLARAAGIHLIVATQRPSTNVVTGLIKSNITNRIAFNVASGIDSRVILDSTGAEDLIGLGDLLLSKPEFAKPQRIQGCYVSEKEINAVVEMVKAQGEPEYHSEILSTNVITIGASNPMGGDGGDDDPLIWEAADIVVSSKMGSTSNIQRRLKVGYARAGRIMDQLEEKGVVGPANGSKPREVLVDELELETIKAFESSGA